MDRSHVVRFLPAVIGRTMTPGSLLEAVAESMASLLDPVDRRLQALDHYFDPFLAPTVILPYLAMWVDLDWLTERKTPGTAGFPPDRLRRLIASAHWFARRRGTWMALENILRVATGIGAIHVKDAIRDPAVTRPFHLVIELPSSARPEQPLVERIVRAEKPVHLTHELAYIEEP